MTPLEQYEHDLELYHQAKTLLEARYVDDSVHVALQIEDDKVRFTIMAKITASRKMTESLKDLYISPEAMQQLCKEISMTNEGWIKEFTDSQWEIIMSKGRISQVDMEEGIKYLTKIAGEYAAMLGDGCDYVLYSGIRFSEHIDHFCFTVGPSTSGMNWEVSLPLYYLHGYGEEELQAKAIEQKAKWKADQEKNTCKECGQYRSHIHPAMWY